MNQKVITTKNILAHEIIGLQAEITESTDEKFLRMSGTIIFESKNMIIVRTKQGQVKQIAKRVAKNIVLYTQPVACSISGSSLIAKPEDRIRLDKKS